MGRIKRQYYQQAVYHVYNRGNNGLKILIDDKDKAKFLEVVARYKKRFDFKIYGIVLMDNHYHMVIETTPAHDISRIMQAVQLTKDQVPGS